MMESFYLLIKIITAGFIVALEVVRMFWGKKCKIIVFGHMDTKLISIKKLSHLTFI